MPPKLNHTIVLAHDNRRGAEFLARVLGVPVGRRFGPFVTVALDNDVTLDFMAAPGDAEVFAHYAFLVSEAEFDEALDRLRGAGIEHYADPQCRRIGEINHDDGGRGLYFRDPTGNTMEIITRPYGG